MLVRPLMTGFPIDKQSEYNGELTVFLRLVKITLNR